MQVNFSSDCDPRSGENFQSLLVEAHYILAKLMSRV